MQPSDDAYTIEAILAPDKSWRALGACGESVVLKRLPADCLRQGQLHPNVKLRLARLRELPLRSFVNLLGVQRTEHGVAMVSEYVAGLPLAEAPPEARAAAVRQARRIVQNLHALGFIHGNLHDRNLILEPTGDVRLIDPSPLLHDDPAIDLAALDRLDPPVASDAEESRILPAQRDRHRSFVAAMVLSILGILGALGMAIHFSG